MALDERTKALMEQTNKLFETPDIQKPDISNWSKISESDIISAQPKVTAQKFEDYSKYIKGAIDPVFGDIDEQRAQSQSNFAKAATILPRIGTKVAAEVAKMPGEIAGFVDWGVSGFNFEDFNEKVNNAWVRSIDEAHAATNDALFPVYKRRVVEEGGLLRQIVSPEFWAEEGADGIGFLLSMFTPGLATRALKVGEKAATKIGKLAKISKPETVAKLGRNIDDYVAGGINTLVESGAEGMEAAKAVEQSIREKKFTEYIQLGFNPEEAQQFAEEYVQSDEAKRMIGKAGSNTVLANFAILLAPNIIDQKWLFSGATKGKIGERLAQDKLGKIVAGLGDETAETITKATTKDFAKEALTKGLIGVGKEGFFEEGLQFASAKYFEDKALLDEDTSFIESLTGTANTYLESLSDIDMQKSIFLGAVLGGGMGAIHGVRGKMFENKILFGDAKTGKEGLQSLLSKNFVERFKSVNDILDSNRPYNEDGSPNVDIAKAKTWASDIIKSEKNKELLSRYEELGLTEQLDFAKTVNDFNYMLPFIQQDGGMDLLKAHIDQLSQKQSEHLKQMGIPEANVQNVKKELLEKAEVFNDIYYGTMLNHRKPKLEVQDKHKSLYKEFDAEVVNTKISNEIMQYTFAKRVEEIDKEINTVTNKIAALESKSNITTVEETELKNLKSRLKSLESNRKVAQTAFDETKTERKELDKKDNIEQWWKDKITTYDTNIKEVAADAVTDAVVNNVPVEDVEGALNDTTLEDKDKAELLKKAQEEAEAKKALQERLNAIDDTKAKTLAQKFVDNKYNPEQKTQFTPEEVELFQSPRVQKYIAELEAGKQLEQEQQSEEEKVHTQQFFDAISQEINNTRSNTQPIEDPNAPENERFKASVVTTESIMGTAEPLVLAAASQEELIQQVDQHYDNILNDLATRLELPAPQAYKRQAIKDVIDISTNPVEITQFDDKVEYSEDEVVALEPSVAYRSKNTIISEGRVAPIYDEQGKVVLEEGVNQDILKPESFSTGTPLVAEIGLAEGDDVSFMDKNKDNIEAIPIKLTTEDGQFVGYIHDVNWYDDKVNITEEDRARLKAITKELRQKFTKDGKIDPSKKLKVKITEKKSGWLNRGKNQLTVKEAFKDATDKHDTRVKLGTINSSYVSDSLRGVTNWTSTTDGRSMIDVLTGKAAGVVIAAVPSANGSYIPTRLNQTTLDKSEKADEILQNVIGILGNAAKDNTVTSNDLFSDLMMYIHPRMGEKLDSKAAAEMMASKPYIMFEVDLFDDKKSRNVTVKVQEGQSRYGVYQIKNDKDGLTVTKGRLNSNTKKLEFSKEDVIKPKDFQNILKVGLKNKYINFNDKAANASNRGQKVKMKVADGNYNVTEKEVDYRDFLSDYKVVTTRVHGVKTKDGFVAYATQPTLVLNMESIVSALQESTQEEVIPESPTDSLIDDGLNSNDIDWGSGSVETIEDFFKVDLEIDYENTSISSFSGINNVVHENNIVTSMTNSLLLQAKDMDLSNKDVSDKFVDNLLEGLKKRRNNHDKYSKEQATKEIASSLMIPMSKEANAVFAKNLDRIIQNFEESRNEDGSVKFVGYRARINMELARLKFVPEVEELSGVADESQTDETHVDNKNFKTDPEKSASARIKRALFSIPLKKDGKVQISMIGLPIPRDYAQTFNTVMEALADVDINEMVTELETLAYNADIKDEIYKQVLDIVNKHKAIQERNTFLNEFLNVFRKQRAKFKTILIFPNEKGLPGLRVMDANKIGSAGIVSGKWYQSHLIKGQESGLIKLNTQEGTMSINGTIATTLKNEFIDVVTNTKNKLVVAINSREEIKSELFKPMADVFSKIGIDISSEALKKLYLTYLSKPGRLTGLKVESGQNTTQNFHNFMKDNFLFIYNGLIESSKQEDVTVEEDGLKNNAFATQSKYINILARMEAIVNPSVLSSSFRNAAGDMLYGFVNPHYMSNTVNQLKNNPESFKTDVFSNYSTWLHKMEGNTRVINRDVLKELDISYFDATKNGKSKKEAVSFENMNPFEKEQTRVALYTNNNSRTGLFLTVAPSDKTTFTLLSAPKEQIQRSHLTPEGKLRADTAFAEKLFSLFVDSEIARINSVVADFRRLNNGDITEGELLNDYHFVKLKDGTRVLGSGAYFFMLPQMNDILANELEKIDKGTSDTISLSTQRREQVKQAMIDQINSLIDLKATDWAITKMFDRLDSTNKKNYNREFGNITDMAILTDYVVNNMVSYANQYMLLTGDPAKFVKVGKWGGSRKDWNVLIDNSAANLFKRAAKDIAPGYEGKFAENEQKYNIVMVNEPASTRRMSKAYKGRLGDLLTSTDKIKLADAQVWSSLPEHLRVLAAIGRITQDKKNQLISKFNAYMEAKTKGELTEDNKFTDAELGLILQPLKPVEVGRLYMNTSVPTAVDIYIKSSVFPLVPQLTEGLEIDKAAMFMHIHGVDKIVPNTAIKAGFFNAMDMYKDGQIILPLDEESKDLVSSKIHQLDRSFFRIQQDVPYDPNKARILKGSQAEKLQFSDLEESWKFNVQNKSYKGWELKEKNDAIRTELYRRKWEKLLKELDAEQEGANIVLKSFNEIKERIIKEAIERNSFDTNDIMLITQLAKEYGNQPISAIPIYLHPAMPKIEPLLNSIIKNDVLVTKFPGKSYVQGSAMGFDYMMVGTEEVLVKATKKTGIVLTNDFTGTLGYRVSKKGDTEYYEADVFLPWYFQEKIEDYITETKDGKYLDTSKIDEELLTLIGYRIPTQGHSSMVKLKVVGFLPKSSGDLIIVPPKMVEQMGSDFDVDKLYTHRYNYTKADNGLLMKTAADFEANFDSLSDQQLENIAMDITHSILENNRVAERVVKSLDNDKIANSIAMIEKLKSSGKKAVNVVDRTKASQTSLLFEDLHSKYVEINASGKFGIGVSSISSTGHILSQYGGLYLKKIPQGEDKFIEKVVRFTDVEGSPEFTDSVGGKVVNQTSVKEHTYEGAPSTGLWRLDRIYSIDGVTKISEVLTNIQTESVDNANNQRLYGMHLNKETFDVALFLAKMGLTEDYIALFLNQPIVKDYVQRILALSDIGSTDYTIGAAQVIADEMFGDYKNTGARTVAYDSMEKAIARDSNQYTEFDKNVLASFIEYKEIASTFGALLRALNTDTKFLGKNLDSNASKLEEFVVDVTDQTLIGNVDNLISEENPTLQYSAFKYGVQNSMRLFKQLVPYGTGIMQTFKQRVRENAQRKKLNEDTIGEINRATRTAIWVKAATNSLGIDNIETKRKELLFGENSLGHRIVKERLTDSNTLLQYIEVTLAPKSTLPTTLEFSAGGVVEKDFSLKLQQSFLELYKSNKSLAEDIITYALLNGSERNARDLSRFIPIDILIDKGIVDQLKTIYSDIFSSNENDTAKKEFSVNLRRQFYQHNPTRAYAATTDLVRKTNMFTNVVDKNTGKLATLAKDLSTAAIIQMGRDSKIVEKATGAIPEFIYFYEDGKIHLFERLLDSPLEGGISYRKLSLLGDSKNLLTEYDMTQANKVSLFPNNKVELLTLKPKSSLPTPTQQPTAPSGVSVLQELGFYTNIDIDTALTNIYNNPKISRGFRELADLFNTQEFSKVSTQVVNNEFILSSGRSMRGIAGTMATSTKEGRVLKQTLYINTDYVVAREGLTAEDFFTSVLLHELTHTITTNKINNRNNLSKEEQAIINNLESLWKQSKEEIEKRLSSMDRTSKEYTALRYLYDLYVSDSYRNVENGALKEFMSGVMTDPNFQNVLNTIKANETQSIWDKIVSILTDMIRLINPDINLDTDSVLAQAVQNVLRLGESIVPIETPALETQEMTELNMYDILNTTITDLISRIDAYQNTLDSNSKEYKSLTATKNLLNYTKQANMAIIDAINSGQRENKIVLKDVVNKQIEDINKKLPESMAKDFIEAVKSISQSIGGSLETTEKTTAEQIYSQLGNKTQSNNVKIVKWGDIKDATEPFLRAYNIISHVISTRVKNSNQHFGNPFSSVQSEISKGLIATKSTKESVEKYIDWVINNFNLEKKNLFTVTPRQAVDRKAVIKASIATQYIGFGEGINNSSTELYRQQAGKYANTGNYSYKDTIFVSIGGKRGTEKQQKEQQDRTIREVLKAIETGATIITDNKAYIDSNSYNTGEKRLYANLEAKGYKYSEKTIDGQLLGVWNKEGNRAEWIREHLQSGKLKGKPIVYYKELGEPSHAIALDYLINKYDWGISEKTTTFVNSIPYTINNIKHTYTVENIESIDTIKITNKEGKEVYTDVNDGNRRMIWLNSQILNNKAVVVEYAKKGQKDSVNYIVTENGDIYTSAKSNRGGKMNWDSNNGDRIAIIELAKSSNKLPANAAIRQLEC